MPLMEKALHPQVVLIAAVARNGVIGAEGGMPWRLPSDLKRFKALTMGRPVVMGRKTFQTLGRPLAGRKNIVVTRSASPVDGAMAAGSLEDGLRAAAAAPGGDIVFVIGGGEIYAQAMDYADRLELTHVDAAPAGDTRFPPVDPADWTLEAEETPALAASDTAPMRFASYVRKALETVRRLRQTDVGNPSER